MKNKNKAPKTRNMRRLRFGTTSTVLTVVVIVGILLLNVIVDVLANRFPLTFDLSADKTFTLSEKSEEIANKVEKDLQIIVFMDESEFTNPSNNSLNQTFTYYYGISIPEFETMYTEFYTALQQYRQLSCLKNVRLRDSPGSRDICILPYSRHAPDAVCREARRNPCC